MSDSSSQEQDEKKEKKADQPAPEMKEADIEKTAKKSKSSLLLLSKASDFFNQYVISIVIILLIAVVVGFLFILQSNWMQAENNKTVDRLVEKKLEESLNEYLKSKEINDGEAGKDKISKMDKKSKSVNKKQPLETEEDKTKYIIEANRLYEQGDYKLASVFYEKGLEKNMPFLNKDFIVYRLGDSYLKTGKYKEALEVFRHLNNDFIDSPYQIKSRLKMGECCAGMGKYKQARETLYSVIALEGECTTKEDKSCVVESYFKIGDYYMEEAKRLQSASVNAGSATAKAVKGKERKHVQ